MKKTILSLSLLTLSCSAFAEKRGWYLGADLTMGGSNIFNANFPTVTGGKADQRFDFYAGENLKAGYMLSPNFGVFAGLGYQSFNWSLAQPKHTFTYVNQNYFTIPLYVRLVTSKSSKPGFFMNTGVKFGVLTTSSVETKSEGGTDAITHNPDVFLGANFSYFNNMGIVLPIGKHIRLDLGPEAQMSFSPNYKTSGVDGNLYAIGFKAGATIYIGK